MKARLQMGSVRTPPGLPGRAGGGAWLLEVLAKCADECEAALARDPAYVRPGTASFGSDVLALVTCASVCKLTEAAVQEERADAQMLAWCADVCRQCSGLQRPGRPNWCEVLVACLECAEACGQGTSDLATMREDAVSS